MADGLSQIVIEKLDKNNFQVWKFKIMNFLMGKGYWEFNTGDENEPPFLENPTQQQIQANKTWHEKARKVLYWLFMNVSDSMIVHIQDAKSPKQAWDTLVKMYNTNTQAHKMQFKQELHNLQKNKMNISDYSTKVKNLVDALASIGAHVDDEDLVAVTLNALGKDYSQFRTSIAVRETCRDFQDLITLLISEEMRVVGTSSNGGSQESAFYSNSNRGREVEVLKPHFKVDTETRMLDIINMKFSFMEVDEETLEEEEVVEVVVEVIMVNNQISTQTVTTEGNLSTWQKIVIKGSMMHEMESYNKGIMHQLAIKVMSNCL
jgi:hypothetical protein